MLRRALSAAGRLLRGGVRALDLALELLSRSRREEVPEAPEEAAPPAVGEPARLTPEARGMMAPYAPRAAAPARPAPLEGSVEWRRARARGEA